MPSSIPVADLRTALEARRIPTITTWNRTEARPRSQSFERALHAEVRDALWMLTKQWQMGEFRGTDAGSPVFAKLLMQITRLTKYKAANGPAELFDVNIPLEAKVERRPVPLRRAGRVISLDLRLVLGRQWLRWMADPAVGVPPDPFIARYPITKPDPTKREDVDICATPDVWDTFQALAGRALDGGLLYEHLMAAPANHAYDGTGISSSHFDAIEAVEKKFLAWVDRFLAQPPQDDNAWVPEQLEYQFATSAPLPDGSEKVYVADGYASGRLDWYSLDVDAAAPPLEDVPGAEDTGLPDDKPFTTIPVPASFNGMPNTRWWTFEDRSINFGDIDASTTDLAKLLFMEFALVYANDWFVVPCTLPAGTLVKVQGLAVTNVFGEHFWIEGADQTSGDTTARWSMFTINVRNAPEGAPDVDVSLLLLPTLTSEQTGAPFEEGMLIRDEVANMAWAIERTVSTPSGWSKPGKELAYNTHNYLQALVGAVDVPPPMKAAVRYQVMNTVPENWIPFIPVHVKNNNREIQLQRAAMLRVLEGEKPKDPVQPLTMLLREGLDKTPSERYFLHEEEVPRAGVIAKQYYARTRWTDGRTYTWLRAQKQTGRGEGSSGLGFDRLVDQNGKESK